MLAGIQEHKTERFEHGDPRWSLLERIAASQHFRSSLRLREFLFYISECAIREAPGDATEQQIGIRVFGRPPGYNSSEDSIVRTHARLLRQKLAMYFALEGTEEELLVEIPKGHYLPVFTSRVVEQTAEKQAPESAIDETHSASSSKSSSNAAGAAESAEAGRSLRRTLWAGLALVLLGSAAALLLWRSWPISAIAHSPEDKFWAPFLGKDATLVIYSNAWFAGDSTSGLRYAPPQTSTSQVEDGAYVDTYTGIGELTSVYDLTKLFDAHHASFILKRSLLVTWDEAKSRNLIFIGSRAENPSLRVLRPTVDFTMEAQPGSSGVVNHHPRQGEPQLYSRAERPLTEDYAILALSPGVEPGKWTLVLSGLTTFGTEAAVEYLCKPETLSELLRQVTGPHGEIRPFEAVLHTTVGGGVPLETRLVTLRVH